jgi:phosphopantetheinyl transferase (holo-ACP synthase)
VSVGNDVVDLADPETRLGGLHPRWGERVFCAAEREALDASRSPHLLHWALWAAKESAYKARRRLEPRAVFSPKDYEIELPSLPAPVGVARGRAFHRGEAFDLEVRLHGESVHAVATSEDEAGARVLWKVEGTSGDPGVAARRLAVVALGSALGLDPAGLRIVRRPPVAIDGARRIEVGVSLSHHGRFVAFACTLADSIRPPAIRPDRGPAARGR